MKFEKDFFAALEGDQENLNNRLFHIHTNNLIQTRLTAIHRSHQGTHSGGRATGEYSS